MDRRQGKKLGWWASCVGFVGLVTLGTAAPAAAQTITDERVWFSLNMQGRIVPEEPWRWNVEVTGRTRDGVSDLDQFIVRPTVGYDLDRRSTIWIGYGLLNSYPDGGPSSKEHRYFQQYTFSNPLAGGTLALRTRLEQRDIDGNDGLAWRVRQQVRYSRPIRPKSPLSLTGYGELFYFLNDTRRSVKGLDQNRLFGGIAYTVSPQSRLEVGYLNQFVNATGRDRMNHIVSGSLTLSF